jgi:hypothetical protein
MKSLTTSGPPERENAGVLLPLGQGKWMFSAEIGAGNFFADRVWSPGR